MAGARGAGGSPDAAGPGHPMSLQCDARPQPMSALDPTVRRFAGVFDGYRGRAFANAGGFQAFLQHGHGQTSEEQAEPEPWRAARASGWRAARGQGAFSRQEPEQGRMPPEAGPPEAGGGSSGSAPGVLWQEEWEQAQQDDFEGAVEDGTPGWIGCRAEGAKGTEAASTCPASSSLASASSEADKEFWQEEGGGTSGVLWRRLCKQASEVFSRSAGGALLNGVEAEAATEDVAEPEPEAPPWAQPEAMPDPSAASSSRDGARPTNSELSDLSEDLMTVEFLQQELLASTALQAEGGAAARVATSSTSTTTLPPTGLSLNAAGDLTAFITALVTNVAFVIFCFFFFGVLRLRYPIMYYNNVIEGIAPDSPPETTWGWWGPVWNLKIDEVARCITLDHAMLLEYTHYCMKTLAIIGIPMICISGPLTIIFGGNAAGEDHLSYLSYGNIQMESPLFWAHPFFVWYVVLVVTLMTHNAMRLFMEKRVKWLYQVSDLRANTVLLESIPEEFRQEDTLRTFISRVIAGASIRSVYFIKDTSQLVALLDKYNHAKSKVREAEAMLEKDPGTVPMIREGYMGRQVEAIPYWKQQMTELDPQVKQERQRINQEATNVGGVNLSTAFVTFADRSSAEIMLRMDCGLARDEDQWEMQPAPQATDILWCDLTQDDTAKSVRTHVGYGLVVGLYFLYMPLVIGITNLAKIIDFSNFGLAPIQPFWQGFAPTLGLQFMVAFLPTFLIIIFRSFFTCRAEAWQQHKLQIWYFWFQVVFVLLATAVGQNVRGFTSTLINNPMGIFSELATTMPYATHFYMNFQVLQWMTHAMNFTRYFPLFKFKAALSIYEEKDAKAFAEPEDQDYYGIGSRSARWSIAMAISLVYGTLCPPMNLLGFLTMLLCRIVYGYLFVYAETRKADTGGAFFVTQLRHVFVSTIIYTILMIGVLFIRSETWGPGAIALPSLFWTIGSLLKFNRYSWEKLPIQDLVLTTDFPSKRSSKGLYVQPEMLEEN